MTESVYNILDDIYENQQEIFNIFFESDSEEYKKLLLLIIDQQEEIIQLLYTFPLSKQDQINILKKLRKQEIISSKTSIINQKIIKNFFKK